MKRRAGRLALGVGARGRGVSRLAVGDPTVGPGFTSKLYEVPINLTQNDRMSEVLERVDDYLSFGVRYVWLLDPRSRRAQIYNASGVHETKNGRLWTTDPEILVPFDALFD